MLNLYKPSLHNLSNNFIWSASLLVLSPGKISETLGSPLCFIFRWSDIRDCNFPQNGHGLLPAKIADISNLPLGFSFMRLASCDCNTPQNRQGFFLTCSDLFGCSSLVGEEFGQSVLGKEPLLLSFNAANFLGCSFSTAGNDEQSDLDEEPVAWGSTEWFLACSSSTGEKLGHSKLEGGSAVSGVTEAEFLGCSLFTKQRLGHSESGKVLVMTGFRDADLFDCASLIRDGLGQSGLEEGSVIFGFTAADFFDCSSSAAGSLEQSDLDEEPAEWGFTEADFCGCSSSTLGKLRHSRWRKVWQYQASLRLSLPPEDTQLSIRNAW